MAQPAYLFIDVVRHVEQPLIEARAEEEQALRGLLELEDVSDGKKRGFWWVVIDLEGDLDADERVEMRNKCLGGE